MQPLPINRLIINKTGATAFVTTISPAKETKTPSQIPAKGLLYWVGESNSYCKIENLEY